MCKTAKRFVAAGCVVSAALLTYTLFYFLFPGELGCLDDLLARARDLFEVSFVSGLVLFAAGAVAELISKKNGASGE